MRSSKKIYSLYLLLLFLTGCTPKEEPSTRPSDILSIEKTAEIMAFVHLSEALLQYNNSLSPEKKIIFNTDIFSEMNTTQEAYENSIKFYSQEPRQLKQINELAMEKINSMKKENNSK